MYALLLINSLDVRIIESSFGLQLCFSLIWPQLVNEVSVECSSQKLLRVLNAHSHLDAQLRVCLVQMDLLSFVHPPIDSDI